MQDDSASTLRRILEANGIPLAAVTGSIAVAIGLQDAAGKLGWRLLSVVSAVVCSAWAAYVWTAKQPSVLDPTRLIRRFDRVPRMSALFALAVSLTPLLYFAVVRYPYPRIPFLLLAIENKTNRSITISEYGEAYFTVVGGPLTSDTIGSGRLEFQSLDAKRSFTVLPGGTLRVAGRFLNEGGLLPLLEREDVALDVMLLTADGRAFRRPGIPFQRKLLSRHFIAATFE